MYINRVDNQAQQLELAKKKLSTRHVSEVVETFSLEDAVELSSSVKDEESQQHTQQENDEAEREQLEEAPVDKQPLKGEKRSLDVRA